MDKTEAIRRVIQNPLDVGALDAATDFAIEESRWNEALTLGGRAVRIHPSAARYRRLSHITSRLGWALSTATYLIAAIRCGTPTDLVQKSRAEWTELKAKLLASSKEVQDIYSRIILSPPDTGLLRKFQTATSSTQRIKDSEELLSKRRFPLLLAAYLTADLTNESKLRDALYVGTAALLHDDVTLHNLINIGGLLIKWRRGKEIVPIAQAAVNLYPTSAPAWSNLGGAFDLMRRPWESINACKEALKFDPNSIVALNNMGNSYKNSGESTQAAKAYERALKLLKWKDSNIFSNYLLSLQYADEYTRQMKTDAHFKYGRLFTGDAHLKPRALKRGIDKLRVGFLSADFANHSAAYFLLPLWEKLKRTDVDVVAYYNNSYEDGITRALKEQAVQWEVVYMHNDEVLLEKIRSDQIDVLIDPAGHTARNRLPVFGMRAAPVQATWLGHPNTTGLKQMDWRVTDSFADPHGAEAQYTEQLARLPLGLFAVYRPMISKPEKRADPAYAVAAPPALERGYITFGCCNNIAKINDEVVAVWAQVLNQCGRSRILIESPGLSQREFRRHTVARFAKHGITEDRLDLRERDGTKQYLIYHEIDICLDPYPCNGGTTTFDLLWMGLPLVTLAGDSFVSRMGVTLLSNLGRTEWIADTESTYINIALGLANDAQRLAAMRAVQRAQMEASPLMDEQRFAKEFADFLWDIHQRRATQ